MSIILLSKSSLIGWTSTFSVNCWVWLFHIVVLPVIILSYVWSITDGFLATIVDAWSILKNICDGLESTTTVVKELWFPRVTVSPFWKNWLVFTLTKITFPFTLAIVPVVFVVAPTIDWSGCIWVPPLPASWNV